MNFFVSLGATETQVRVLRSTARAAFEPRLSVPVRTAPPAPRVLAKPGAGLGAVPTTRFVKYLARLEGLDALTPVQLGAVYRALEYAAAELARGGARLRSAGDDGPRARALVTRVREQVASALRAADVPDGELLARLVRVVLASAG